MRRIPAPYPFPEGWQLTAVPAQSFHAIAVDASLLHWGREVSEIRMPLQPVPPASAAPIGSGLMLGAAIVLTADLTPDEDALLGFVQTLRFHPDNFRKSRPVLAETAVQGMLGRVVRDGAMQRAYFCGDACSLASLCGLIWDGQPRAVTPEDLSQIPPSAGYIGFATAVVLLDGLLDLTYLGSLAVADAPNTALLAAMQALSQQGCTVAAAQPGYELPPNTLLVASAPGGVPTLIPPTPQALGLADAVRATSDRIRYEGEVRRQAQLRVRLALAAGLMILLICGIFLCLTGTTGLPLSLLLMVGTACVLLLPGNKLLIGAAILLFCLTLLIILKLASVTGAFFALLSGCLSAVCVRAIRRGNAPS